MLKKSMIGLIASLFMLTSTNAQVLSVEPLTISDQYIMRLMAKDNYRTSNHERYLKYKDEKSIDDLILYVNMYLDYPYYTHDVEALNQNKTNVIVNKYYALGSDYKPDLRKPQVENINSHYMEKEASKALEKMFAAASNDGLEIALTSGYRSYQRQVSLYDQYVANDGVKMADTYSARPGHSEHQTGLAADVVASSGSVCRYSIDCFEQTDQFAWLEENAHKYGFILRFPSDKVEITGYKYEPWHYRYVGVELATQLKNNNLTLEEYYGLMKGIE